MNDKHLASIDISLPLKPFDGPRLKLARARRHLFELSTVLDEYQQDLGAAYVQIGNGWTLKLSKELPYSIALIVGDLIHNLRSSLDIMVCDIAAQREVGRSGMSFPFAKSEEDFLDLTNSRSGDRKAFLKLGTDVTAAITALRPWTNGNAVLRGIHDLDIADKHRLIIPIPCFLSTRGDMAAMAFDFVNELIKKENPGHPLIEEGSILNLGGGPLTAIVPGEILKVQPGRHPADYWPIAQASVKVVFAKDSAFQGESVVEACDKATKFLEETVESFALQFG